MLQIEEGKLLKNVSTFGIGGKAKYWADVFSLENLQEAFNFCRNNRLPFFILGNGSNCLFDDRGFNGVIIHNKIADCQFLDERVVVGSGYSFSLLSKKAIEKNLKGLEFAIGIPGTIGGAVFMNAGAHGKSISQYVEKVAYLSYSPMVNQAGELTDYTQEILKEKMQFDYRSSIFQKMQGAIVSVTLKLSLSQENPEEMIKKQKTFLEQRRSSQPYDEKSAGSVFRNPENQSAGALIESCGLKGFIIGGAKVSEKHANFIVNHNQATAQDVLALIKVIQEKVKEKHSIALHPEIFYLSYDGVVGEKNGISS